MKLFQLQETGFIEHRGADERGWKTVERYETLAEAKEALRTRPTNWSSLRLHVDIDEVEALRVEAARLRGDLEWSLKSGQNGSQGDGR